MGQIYKIKLEDKAALLNKLEKYNISVDSYSINDNKLGGYFEFEITNPTIEPLVKKILNSSSKINKIKESLKQIIREELKKNLGK